MGITKSTSAATGGSHPSRAARGETVSEIVHELRSPLSVITGYAALLREQPLSPPSTDFVDAIARSAHDLERRLKDLTDSVGADDRPPTDAPTGGAEPRRAPADVLCIEDDRGTATLVEHILGEKEGVSVVCASRGAQGLETARASVPDLILLDLHLGDMGGEAVLRNLRSDPATAAIPVLVLSGAVDDTMSTHLLSIGADAVVAKPFLPDDLRHEVRRLLEEDAATSGEPLDLRYLEAFEHLEDAAGLVETMIEDALANLDDLRAAVRSGDSETAAGRVHALRGGMANLGAYVVAEEALGLEAAVRDGCGPGAPDLLVRLESAMQDAETALRRRVSALRVHR